MLKGSCVVVCRLPLSEAEDDECWRGLLDDLALLFKLRCDHDHRRLPRFAVTSCHIDWLLSESLMILPWLAGNPQALHSLLVPYCERRRCGRHWTAAC